MGLYEELLSQLDSTKNEQSLKPFLDENIILIRNALNVHAWNCVICKPQFKLGSKYIADYVILSADSGQWYVTLIEVQSHHDKIFNANKNFTKQLNEAIRQVNEWEIWINNHSQEFRDSLSELVKGRPAFCSSANLHTYAETEIRDTHTVIRPVFKILIGRRSSINQELNERRNLQCAEIITFDRLLDYAKRLDKTENI